MKRQWMIAITAVGCITPLWIPAYAQEPAPVVSGAGQAATTGPRTVVATVTARVTADRPYSAEAVNESVQLLPDGNKIHRTSVTKVYRDSAGRTRREMLNDDGTVRSITISDPVATVSYTLDPATKTATRGGATVGGVGRGGAMAMPSTAPVRAVASGGGGERGGTVGMATLSRDSSGAAVAGSTPVRTVLEPQVIEGLNATGTRVTTIIPAGQVGNAQELKIISEQWNSDELQLLLMTKHSDPRSGESIYRLRNVLRAEPDPSLFMVPGDFSVRERR